MANTIESSSRRNESDLPQEIVSAPMERSGPVTEDNGFAKPWVGSLSQDRRDKIIDKLNEILRGEISAVETYKQVEDKLKGDELHFVMTLEQEHQEAVRTLRDHIIGLGGQPEESSGPWGAFAKAVEGTAKIFGESTALKALQAGESKGLRDYQAFVNDEHFPSEIRHEFRARFIPNQQRRIQQLQNLIH